MSDMFMRKLFLLFVLASLCGSCRDKTEPKPHGTVSTADSLSVVADTTSDSVAAPVPQAADEVFDDFLYAFTTNARFQRSRILFPLSQQIDGRAAHAIDRGRWKFNTLHLRGDYFTVLYGNEKQMKAEKQGNLHHASVELIDLKRSRVTQYVFGRRKGQWCLNQICIKPLSEHAHAEFFTFYNHFATDSLFQYQHLAPTLGFTTYDAENHYERIHGYVNRDQWSAFRPELPEGTLTNIDYGQTYTNPNLRVFVMNGNSNGMQSVFTFRKENGRWRLTSFEN